MGRSDFKFIVDQLPYSKPFLFVEGITAVDETGIEGYYTYSPSLDFYKGHFKEFPITPGVILTETMAQIGLVCFGIYLLEGKMDGKLHVAFTSSEVEFLKPVFPGERVTVKSSKDYFRFHKLKCRVELYNAVGELACRGVLAGMLKVDEDA
ncbi:MAG: hydroxymyristoyl-ACP dehydratase [Saprospiraceae bacterium]|nr:hydroxymyristoyl-ACP dehydratase [Saprospiraceae bacterium]